MIKIIIDGVALTVSDIQEAINALYSIKKYQILSKSPRCHKCVYEYSCHKVDVDESCNEYKRDPPDGGYYG